MTPREIALDKKHNLLLLHYAAGVYAVPAFVLRALSPAADTGGFDVSDQTLAALSPDVALCGIEPVGHYAVRLHFSDGHDNGLYSWEYLHKIALQAQTRDGALRQRRRLATGQTA